jgi:hypothetical protein
MNSMKSSVLSAAILGFSLLSGSAGADVAIFAQGGSLGTGVGLGFDLNQHMNVRLGVNSSEYEGIVDIDDEDGLTYQDPEIEFDNKYLFLDFYPFRQGNLHLTLGYVQNDNSITLAAQADENAFIGDQAVPAGTGVAGKVVFDDGAYAGIGWGNAFGRNSVFEFGLDVGVLMQGSPQVDLTVTGDFDVPEEEVAREEQEAEDEVKDNDMWPVVSVSFAIRF